MWPSFALLLSLNHARPKLQPFIQQACGFFSDPLQGSVLSLASHGNKTAAPQLACVTDMF